MSTYALFKEASKRWDHGDMKGAFALFFKAAQLNDPSSQHNLGYFYEEGVGTRKNRRRALYWYKRAWKTDAQTSTCSNIARLYADAGNTRRAIRWWMMAVDMGDGDAALDLARFILNSNRRGAEAKAIPLLKRVRKSHHVTTAAVDEATLLLRKIQRNS